MMKIKTLCLLLVLWPSLLYAENHNKIVVYEVATGKAISWASSMDLVADPLPPGLATKAVNGSPEGREYWDEATLTIKERPVPPPTAIDLLKLKKTAKWTLEDIAEALQELL